MRHKLTGNLFPLQTVIVNIKLQNMAMKDHRSYLGSLYFITGDEISRQKFRASLRSTPKKKVHVSELDANDPVLSVDFDVAYQRETSYNKGECLN